MGKTETRDTAHDNTQPQAPTLKPLPPTATPYESQDTLVSNIPIGDFITLTRKNNTIARIKQVASKKGHTLHIYEDTGDKTKIYVQRTA